MDQMHKRGDEDSGDSMSRSWSMTAFASIKMWCGLGCKLFP